MKTINFNNSAGKMATAICAAIVFGTSVLAQPNPERSKNDDVNEAFERLEALISNAEQDAKYVAPSVDYDDLRPAMERLEFLATKTANEIKYTAPVEDQMPAVEYAATEDNPKTRDDKFLTYINNLNRVRK